MSKLINELITILSATNQLLEIEQRQAESKLKMADYYDGRNAEMAANLRKEALTHHEKAQSYYETTQVISERIYGEKEVTKLGITDAEGTKVEKPANAPVSTEITYPQDDAALAVFNAFNEHADKALGMEAAMKKVEYFFFDEIDKRSAKDKKDLEEKLASPTANEDTNKKAQTTYEDRVAKHTRLIAKEKIREGQKLHIDKLKVEALAEANPAKMLNVKSPQEILKIQYWQNNKFNYKIFEGGSEDKAEDLIKLEAVHLHSKGKTDDAVALLRTFYSSLNWDTLKAQQFLYAMLNEENPHTHARIAAKGFVVGGLKGNGKKAYSKGVEQAKKFLKAWFRTEDVDSANKPIYMVNDEKLNKILDEVIAEAKAEVNGKSA